MVNYPDIVAAVMAFEGEIPRQVPPRPQESRSGPIVIAATPGPAPGFLFPLPALPPRCRAWSTGVLQMREGTGIHRYATRTPSGVSRGPDARRKEQEFMG